MNKNNERLLKAAGLGDLKKVKKALKAGADLEAKDKDGWTALMFAAWYGRKEIVEFLIQAGADMEAKTNDGGTALMLATWYGRKEIETILKNEKIREKKR